MNVSIIVNKPKEFLPFQIIERRILLLRGMKIMLDSDLSELYEVTTARLNEQVGRNKNRFPIDFMFQHTDEEYNSLRSQFAISKIGRGGRRYLPYAFTEHGVAMLSSVLKSDKAVEVNITIVRAFIRLREILASDKELGNKILEFEREQKMQNKHINSIYSILDKLIDEPIKEKGPMGFVRE